MGSRRPVDTTGMGRGAHDDDCSWLIPDHADRERMLDMDHRLQPIRRVAFGVLGLTLIAAGPWIGYWTLAPLVAAGLFFAVADGHIGRARRPEYWIFSAWVGSQAMIALSVVLGGLVGLPAIAWFAIPVVTLSARFSNRGIALGVLITIAMLLAVALGTQWDAVQANPPVLLMPIGLVLATAILSTALMRSDFEHRTKAVVDPLTGMLNRKALESRVIELRQQSEVAPAPISLVVIDIDHFKHVNDSIGHAGGDRVLQEVAYLIRKDLRAYDLAYRLGGEEFVVVLPGADLDTSRAMADRLRETIEEASFAMGTAVTVSCGVSASAAGEVFLYQRLFAEADAALYEAKRAGRNRVEACGEGNKRELTFA
jgi:diguanylate cyclase (GGDEF)-like protein